MATRIYENVMILSQQPLATEILKSSFVDNISKSIFVFFLQWSKMENIQSSVDHCFDSYISQTTSSPSYAKSVVHDAKENREKRKMAARNPDDENRASRPRFSSGHFFLAVYLRSRSTDYSYSVINIWFSFGLWVVRRGNHVFNAKLSMEVIRIYQVLLFNKL